MSASPMARQAWSGAQAIPTRKILVTDPSQMPEVYSATPGGTLYSTTPGGTRLIYEKGFMMNLKSSPLSQTPPNNLPQCLLRGQPKQKFQRAAAAAVAVPSAISRPAQNVSDDHHHHELFQLEL